MTDTGSKCHASKLSVRMDLIYNLSLSQDGQRTLQDSFNSQISVVRTSARSTANRSRVVFEEDDDD